ncbi:MAG: nucleotidyl transferase AbiEii/AbiGii toxin family protein, partial [Galactobacter sp.]
PSRRETRHIRCPRNEGNLRFTVEDALADLKRLAAIDLGDHFRFEYLSHGPSIGADTQPYTDGFRVTFSIFIGVMGKGALHIDLAVGAGMTGQVTTATPATALELPRLTRSPYRLYPVVDQIADKVCATMAEYDGRPSSREKDLVDLIVLAVTQDIDGATLTLALESERRRRQMEPFSAFAVPPTWGPGYVKLSKSVPHCSDYRTVQAAADLASQFIDPVLTGRAGGKRWTHNDRRWA